MTRYKININRSEVDPGEINRHKNFGKIKKQYYSTTKSIFKNGWFLSSMAAACVVVISTVAFMLTPDNQNLISDNNALIADSTIDNRVLISDNNALIADSTTVISEVKSVEIAENKAVGDSTIKKKKVYRIPTKVDYFKKEEKISITNATIRKTAATDIKSFVKPPIKELDKPMAHYTISPGKSRVITHESGSKIRIPANAFVDAVGKTVTEGVDIQYREFMDPVDFFLSGIPMSYDSAGTEYQFESAGMIEILGFCKGKPVYVNPTKKIQIEMMSDYSGTEYNLYVLDTLKENWEFLGKDEVVEVGNSEVPYVYYFEGEEEKIALKKRQKQIKKASEELAEVQEQVKNLKKKKPVKPQKTTENKFHFNINVDQKEFPEIAIYKNMLFEAVDDDANRDNANLVWDEVAIQKNENDAKNGYTVTFSKRGQSASYQVIPVFDEGSYEEAMKLFQKKYGQYSSLLIEKRAEEKRKKEEYEYLQSCMAERKQQLAEQRNIYERADPSFQVYRIFTVNGFGTYNCDSPAKYPRGNTIAVKFSDEDKYRLRMNLVYLVDRRRNAIFPYSNSRLPSFRYNPNSRNVIWGITFDNKLAYCEFDKSLIIPKNSVHTFAMNVVDVDGITEKEIRELLKI